jgi:hypothetical protein
LERAAMVRFEVVMGQKRMVSRGTLKVGVALELLEVLEVLEMLGPLLGLLPALPNSCFHWKAGETAVVVEAVTGKVQLQELLESLLEVEVVEELEGLQLQISGWEEQILEAVGLMKVVEEVRSERLMMVCGC